MNHVIYDTCIRSWFIYSKLLNYRPYTVYLPHTVFCYNNCGHNTFYLFFLVIHSAFVLTETQIHTDVLFLLLMFWCEWELCKRETYSNRAKKTTRRNNLKDRRVCEGGTRRALGYRDCIIGRDGEYGWLRIPLQATQSHHRPDGPRMFPPLDGDGEMERWWEFWERKRGITPTLHMSETTGSRAINGMKTEGGRNERWAYVHGERCFIVESEQKKEDDWCGTFAHVGHNNCGRKMRRDSLFELWNEEKIENYMYFCSFRSWLLVIAARVLSLSITCFQVKHIFLIVFGSI